MAGNCPPPRVCNLEEYRRLLGKGDTIHDFCDIERVNKKLIYGKQQGFIKQNIDTGSAARDIYNKIFNLLEVNNCGIPSSFDENGLLKFFYGDRSSEVSIESISTNYSELEKHVSLAKCKHLEYQIPYEDVTKFIELLNTISPAKYIMDHTYLSPFLCSLPQKVGANTIAKAYDRTIENTADECSDYVPVTGTVLTKAEGELFFFDEIRITGDMTLEWTGAEMSGIIDINKMIQTKSYAGLENLTTAIIAFHQGIQPIPAPILIASNDILKECYGLDINEFITRGILDQYLLALTDLKRMGDLLQVKLAKLLNATFISNDRMSILLSTIGYNHRSIRTSKTPSANERSDRIIALYNFDSSDTTAQLDQYYKGLLNDYTVYVNEYFKTIKLSFKELQSRSPGFNLSEIFASCKSILTSIQANISLNPIISKTDPIESTTGRAPRHYNPQWINKNVIVYRGLFKYIEYLCIVLEYLNYIISSDFSQFQKEINDIIYNPTDIPSKNKLENIRSIFDNYRIPHPNTLLKIVSNEDISSSLINLYTFINWIGSSLDIDNVTQTMEQMLPMPLFGEPMEYYKKTILKLFKDIRPTPLTTFINGTNYNIGLSSNSEKIIEMIVDIEKYFNDIINRYSSSQIGGRRKNKTKKKGGDNELIDSLPDDIIDQTLTKLITDLYEAQEQGRKDDVDYYLVIYMQLQLIAQQYDISLPLIGEATTTKIAIPNQNKLTQQLTMPTRIMSQVPMPTTVIAAAAGGNKKSKQPVKGGKSKKEVNEKKTNKKK